METVEFLADASGNSSEFWNFGLRFCINILVIYVLIRLIYYPRHKNKDFLFTFILFNVINFLICILLSAAKIKMGFAFGLFAIFSILRYRTVTVPVREMGYFFISVAVGLINALAVVRGNPFTDINNFPYELLLANGIVLALVLLLDRKSNLQHQNFKEINYERIDLIQPAKRADMIEDLRNRTGLPINRVEIIKIDFLRDVATIHAFYLSTENESSSVDPGGDDD
jgi:magnesium-transporting ATPase (P-type)